MNIKTNDISIFPLAKNRPNDRSARLFYENNVANLIRQVVDVEGFLISKDAVELSALAQPGSGSFQELYISTVKPLVFNLYGYYFSIAPNANIYVDKQLTAETDVVEAPLYAVLNIDDITNEIVGFDNVNSEYEGLYIGTDFNERAPEGRHYIKLLDFKAERQESGDWTVTGELCSESYQKISSQSLDMAINKIDGKH